MSSGAEGGRSPSRAVGLDSPTSNGPHSSSTPTKREALSVQNSEDADDAADTSPRPSICGDDSIENGAGLGLGNFNHIWFEKDANNMALCTLCCRVMGFGKKKALKCASCKLLVHARCKDEADQAPEFRCKPMYAHIVPADAAIPQAQQAHTHTHTQQTSHAKGVASPKVSGSRGQGSSSAGPSTTTADRTSSPQARTSSPSASRRAAADGDAVGSASTSNTTDSTMKHLHHWVYGNYSKRKCAWCQRSCGSLSISVGKITSVRCAWCKLTGHRSCIEDHALDSACDLGRHKYVLLAPAQVSIRTERLHSEESSDLLRVTSSGSAASSTTSTASNSTSVVNASGIAVPAASLSLSASGSSGAAGPQHHGRHQSASKQVSIVEPKGEVSAGSDNAASSASGGSLLAPEHAEAGRRSSRSKSQKRSMARKSKRRKSRQMRRLIITERPASCPLLVFINPKSGGKQGVKLLHEFQSLLNPLQVVDLTRGGPLPGLMLFSSLKNFRVLVCGGDGTAGWVLSSLDKLGLDPRPPIGILPLGTGNDLARALRWGGGYSEEKIPPILDQMEVAEVVHFDRWNLHVTPFEVANDGGPSGAAAQPPLDVINNYFSVGADANTALAFHQAREKNPDRFKSRIGNKMYYGVVGGMDILKHSMKDLYKSVTLTCDDQDYTSLILKEKLEGIVFLNIPSYAGGTNPWGNRDGDNFFAQALDDGFIEVLGITSSFDLAMQQARMGSGFRICQCKRAVLTTAKALPVQVDGEPCLLAPSVIDISFRNQGVLLRRAKGHSIPNGGSLRGRTPSDPAAGLDNRSTSNPQLSVASGMPLAVQELQREGGGHSAPGSPKKTASRTQSADCVRESDKDRKDRDEAHSRQRNSAAE
eukprot:Opistho-2@44325